MSAKLKKDCTAPLSAADICALAQGTLNPEESLPLLEHLDACPACMDAYIQALSRTAPLPPPDGLDQRVMEAVHREAAQQESQGSHEQTGEKQTVLVMLPAFAKLLAAVALTMTLFFCGVFDSIGNGARNLVESISTSATERQEDEEPGRLAKWSQTFDESVQHFVEQFNAFFARR